MSSSFSLVCFQPATESSGELHSTHILANTMQQWFVCHFANTMQQWFVWLFSTVLSCTYIFLPSHENDPWNNLLSWGKYTQITVVLKWPSNDNLRFLIWSGKHGICSTVVQTQDDETKILLNSMFPPRLENWKGFVDKVGFQFRILWPISGVLTKAGGPGNRGYPLSLRPGIKLHLTLFHDWDLK